MRVFKNAGYGYTIADGRFVIGGFTVGSSGASEEDNDEIVFDSSNEFQLHMLMVSAENMASWAREKLNKLKAPDAPVAP